MIKEQEQKVQVAEGGKGIEEDKTGTEPDGGGGGVSAKGGCGDYRGRGCGVTLGAQGKRRIVSVSQKHTVSHSINVARSSPKIAVVVVNEVT